jgi:hypothetical protein
VGQGTYDTAQVCLNGHRITGSYHSGPQFRMDYCTKCGAKTIHACPECGTDIRGYYRGGAVIGGAEPPVASFCHGCGEPYPWTKSAVEAARELIADNEELTEEEREQLSASLDDLVRDSARTEVAARRFKRLAAKAGIETASGLKSVLFAVATEAAKRAIWP